MFEWMFSLQTSGCTSSEAASPMFGQTACSSLETKPDWCSGWRSGIFLHRCFLHCGKLFEDFQPCFRCFPVGHHPSFHGAEGVSSSSEQEKSCSLEELELVVGDCDFLAGCSTGPQQGTRSSKRTFAPHISLIQQWISFRSWTKFWL